MKKFLIPILIIILALCLYSCNSENMDEETGPFSLIGTWEATGEFLNDSGKKITYECTLIFDESEFTETTHSKSADASIDFTVVHKGTYVQGEEVITGTFYELYDDGKKSWWQYEYNEPYKFINKNTLEYAGIQLSTYTKNVTFKRKS